MPYTLNGTAVTADATGRQALLFDASSIRATYLRDGSDVPVRILLEQGILQQRNYPQAATRFLWVNDTLKPGKQQVNIRSPHPQVGRRCSGRQLPLE
jgi:hypothetical protein